MSYENPKEGELASFVDPIGGSDFYYKVYRNGEWHHISHDEWQRLFMEQYQPKKYNSGTL